MNTNRLRVLIADDEEGIRESLGLILSQEFDVDFAEDGQQALAKFNARHFDLLLLDIKMPKVDGLEIIRRLNERRATPAILMLTAYQSVELAKEAVRLGARDYLSKPFEREQVLTAVHGILAQS